MNTRGETRWVWLGMLTISTWTLGAVKLPALVSDHMVLQQGMKAPIWGWAQPGEQVTVSIGGQAKPATADAQGNWRVVLDPLTSGPPTTLTVKGTNEITVKDVLVGEVWLGSGQSNMAMQVSRAKDFDAEKTQANLPQVRMFTVSSGAADSPQADCKGAWVVCSPETVGGFSATLYFMGREIHRLRQAPVGLINSSVGGTPIESWIDPEKQRAAPELADFFAMTKLAEAKVNLEAVRKKYEKDLAKWQEAVKQARLEKQPTPAKPRDPLETAQRKANVGGLYNGKIAPLVGYGIRGAVWYQGEANSADEKAPFYHRQLSLLVTDWRAKWGQGDFPFAWVQLPNFTRAGEGWMIVREQMLQTLKLPSTGMAITIDVGEAKDIHPKNKQEVGNRLAKWALGTVYGMPGAISGPLVDQATVTGPEVVVTFKHADGGLQVKNGDLAGFEVAGVDNQWRAATAKIVGASVRVKADSVAEPVAVRYLWADNPTATLYNAAGLPASPFRWKKEQ